VLWLEEYLRNYEKTLIVVCFSLQTSFLHL
jgi:ATPase subunit of ABC transporter with duplicated ATPase domains